jgi:murein DD-endopeptidase
MHNLLRTWMFPIFILVIALKAQSTIAQAPPNAPVEIRNPVAPVAAKVGGRTVLAYELHITNFQSRDVTLNRVQVFGSDAALRPVAVLEGDDLIKAITRPGVSAPPADKRVIAGGMRAIVYLWLTFDGPEAVPPMLRHRFLFAVLGPDGKSVDRDVDAARVGVSTQTPIVLQAPFKGGGIWVAGNGPSNTSDHRRAMLSVLGNTAIAQRFAIDWLKLGADGKGFHGDGKVNANWYGYGTEVVAVVDGVVSEVKDGIPENVPLTTERAVPITLETIAGNHLVLSLGSGRFALYAHLQPGSLRAKTGDRVRRGQVLGLLGNSGNSDAPHLHFHITDGSSMLQSEGLPYELESFSVLGTADLDAVIEHGWRLEGGATPDKRQRDLPVENGVLKFD